MQRFLFSVILIATTAAGNACVSQQKYDQLQAELDACKQNLADTEAACVKDRSALSDALTDMRERNSEARERIQEYRDLLAKFKDLIDAGKLKVKIVDGRMTVELPSDILFASGSADLSPEGRATIKEITSVLVEVAERKYQIEGHTDDWPINTRRFRSNWELGAGRAITVVNTMIDAGMPPGRVSAASFAETQPVGDNETNEGRAHNRRIEIVILPDLSSLPGFDELEKLQEEKNQQDEGAGS